MFHLKSSFLLLMLALAGCVFPAQTQVQGGEPEEQAITAMSYNIRLNTPSDGDNAWPRRRNFLASQVLFHAPDVIGIQEGLPGQVTWLADHLTGYAFVGEGRDGGDNGEYSAIFYNKHKFRVEASGTFWLSPTPAVPSKGWDAALNRICTWVRLAPAAGGPAFLVFNTHFDHIGNEARSRSAELILAMMHSLNPGQLPCILTGDLNLTPDTEPLQLLSKAMTDTYTVAPVRLGPDGTFNGFNHATPATRRIDYIFASPATKVTRFATLTDAIDGRYPSDHFAVIASLHLRPRH